MAPGCSIKALDFAEHATDLTGPYALRHFLPAGLLSLTLLADIVGCHIHPSHAWHYYSGRGVLTGLLQPEDEPLARLLDFLILHKVYLIPYDLANVEGQLRRRDEATVLNPARKYLRTLLFKLCADTSAWDGHVHGTDSNSARSIWGDGEDNRTLAEIYNTLPSPVIREDDASTPLPLVHRILAGGAITGLSTTLHQYQRRSVAAMVQRELRPGSIPDPLYVSLRGIDGTTFYLQPATMEILRDRPRVFQRRGGILCEELGTGKTVMTLALIMSTMDQLPAPEESILDPRPVMTPLSFRHFPSPTYVEARNRFSQRLNKRTSSESDAPRIPSLVEYALDLCRLNPGETKVHQNDEVLRDRHLWAAFKRDTPFYHHYEDVPLTVNRTSRKARGGKGPKTMYLTSGTLVVVPANLMNQWANEMNKHCDYTLKRYIVTGGLPPAQKLALNDVVLMSHARLSQEAARLDPKNAQQLYHWDTCPCSPAAGSSVRVPRCCCDPPKDISPLLQIRWKRLVVDEGNNLSNANTVLFTFIKDISVESKWIVTGTPTTNLMGLQLGSAGELQYPLGEDKHQREDEDADADEIDPEEFPTQTGRRPTELGLAHASMPSLSFPMQRSRSASPTAEELNSSPRYTRVWTKEDRGDLTKLGTMISSFLEVPQFAADLKLFGSHVIAPLMDPTGPKPGSIQVLTQVMESTMIRHRIEDLESEIVLPVLNQETVLLDLDPLAVKSYNALQAAITINAVTSERVGVDYMFHPRNTAALQTITENTSQCMFWHTDEDLFGVEDALVNGKRYLDKTIEAVQDGRISREDLQLYEDSLRELENASTDPVWRALQAHPFVFPRVYNLPMPIYHAWSHFPDAVGQVIDQQSPLPHVFLNTERLARLRDFVIRHPLSPVPRLIEMGAMVQEEDQHRADFNLSRARKNKGLKRQRDAAKRDMSAAARADSAAKLLAVQDRIKEMGMSKDHISPDQPASVLLQSSPLAGVRWGNSPSTKLNYILNEVHTYSGDSKFLIFSKSPLTLVYIAEGLSLLNVKYKITVSKPVKELEQDVMTFESSDTFRVFLMELKHGARGLNLVTASRVIFCEPVWQADVETQAIKRVHRIGQTSPVTVKTLAIRSTSEEVMVSRREDLKRGLGSSGGKFPKLTDDSTMRDFIANPKFLPLTRTSDSIIHYPLLPEMPYAAERGSSPDRITLSVRPSDEGDYSSITIRISPRKRGREIVGSQGDEGSEDWQQPGYIGQPPPPKKHKANRQVRFA